ncbi:MAG: hypothetical protein AAGA58_04385 [Verrucomicrobiota bacterium]
MTERILISFIVFLSTSVALVADDDLFDPSLEILEAEIRMAEKQLMGSVAEAANLEAELAQKSKALGDKHPDLVELKELVEILFDSRAEHEVVLQEKLHKKRAILEELEARNANLASVRLDIKFSGGNAALFVANLEQELRKVVRQPFNIIRAGELNSVELPNIALKEAKLEHVAKTVEIASDGAVRVDFDAELLVVEVHRKSKPAIGEAPTMTTVLSLAPLVAGLPSEKNREEAMQGLDQLILKSFEMGESDVPRLAIEPRTNALIVKGTPEQIEQVKSIVEVFGEHLAFTGGERDAERTIDKVLRETIVSLDFQDTPLSEVIDYLRNLTEISNPDLGVNFLVEGKQNENTLTLKLQNIPLSEALKYISGAVGVKYQVDDHVVVFYDSSDDPFGG